jgi:hypothetical protein
MSAANDSESGSGTPPDGPGVLSNLPRTRPQRSSPRRVAAREATAAATATLDAPARSAAGQAKPPKSANGSSPQSTSASGSGNARKTSTRTAKTAGATKRARRPSGTASKGRDRFAKQETVPRQGFECEGERANGPVQPPGGAELLASATEIFSEVAKAGLSTGERLFRDVLSRLPIS